jgi:hypothetical protein
MVAGPTQWQRIGDEIKAALIFTRADFVNVFKRLDSRMIHWWSPVNQFAF